MADELDDNTELGDKDVPANVEEDLDELADVPEEDEDVDLDGDDDDDDDDAEAGAGADGDDGDDGDDGEKQSDAPAAPSEPKEDEDEDDEDDDDDVEADLDTILKERLAAPDDEEEDEEETVIVVTTEDGQEASGKRSNEILCSNCFLIIKESQLGPAGARTCPSGEDEVDCAAIIHFGA